MQNINRGFLSAQADAVDVHLGGKTSLFQTRGCMQSSNFLLGYSDITAEPAGGYGATSYFTLTQDCDYIGSIWALLDFGQVTSTGAGTDYPRYVDWLGFAALENIRVVFTSNRIQEFTGDDLMAILCISRRTDDDQSELVKGGLQALPSTRAANAAATSCKVFVPLDLLFFSGRPRNMLPYNIECLRDKLRIEMTIRPKTSLIESDGSDITAAFNSIKLRIQKVHVSDEEQSQMLKTLVTPSPHLKLNVHGRMITVQERQENTNVTATSNDQTVNMTVSRPTKEIIAYWRKDDDLPNGSIKSNIQHYNYQPMEELMLVGGTRPILDRVSGEFVKYALNNRFHSGDPSKDIYTISHSFAPEAENDQAGYLNYGAISQPTFTFKTTGAAAGKLSLLYQTHNVIAISEGDLRVLQA